MGKLAEPVDSVMKKLLGQRLLAEVRKEDCDTELALQLVREDASLSERMEGKNALMWVAWNGHPPALAVAMMNADMEERAMPRADREEAFRIAKERMYPHVAQVISMQPRIGKKLMLNWTINRAILANSSRKQLNIN